jgi:hypothetical protein
MCALTTLYVCVVCLLRLDDYPVCMAWLLNKPLWWHVMLCWYFCYFHGQWLLLWLVLYLFYILWCVRLIMPKLYSPKPVVLVRILGAKWSCIYCIMWAVWESHVSHWPVRPKGINSVLVVNLYVSDMEHGTWWILKAFAWCNVFLGEINMLENGTI